MVLKGVIRVHNTKSGNMVLNEVNHVHNGKIRSYGFESSQLGTICKTKNNIFNIILCHNDYKWALTIVLYMFLSIPYTKAEHQWGCSCPWLMQRPVLLRRCLCSPNINPRTCTFPMLLVPDIASPIKAEPTAHNNTQNLVFVPRHGGSSEPALPPTDTLDRWQKERRNSRSSHPAFPRQLH